MSAFRLLHRPWVYLEMGQDRLKAVVGAQSVELPFERLENGRLNPAGLDRLETGLRNFCQQQTGSATARGICAIGARGVSIRHWVMPTTSKEELQRLLRLQIEREFPVGPDELAWGYLLMQSAELPATPSRVSNPVLLVAVKRQILEEYSAVLARCGLQVEFTLAALARAAACPPNPASYGLLDIAQNHSEFVSVENGTPRLIRVLPWGSETFREMPEESSETKAVEQPSDAGAVPPTNGADRESVLHALQPHLSGDTLYVTGDGHRAREWAASLTPGQGKIEAIDTPSGTGHSLAILGLQKLAGKNGGLPPLLLRSAPVPPSQNKTLPIRTWRWAALAAALAGILLALRYTEPLLERPRLSTRVGALQAFAQSVPNLDRDLGFLQYLKSNQPPYLGSIHSLAGAAPAGTRMDTVSLNRRGDFSLRATFRDPQQVVDFRTKLIESGLFGTVVVDEQTPSSDRQKVTVHISGQWKEPSPHR